MTTVFSTTRFDFLGIPASTALSIARSQMCACLYDLRAAIANTQPLRQTAIACAYRDGANVADDIQPTKTLAGNILNKCIRYGNDLGYSGVGHRNLQLLCSGRGRSQKSSAAIFVPALTSIIAQMSEAA
jgi:hypothetical protein